MVKLKGYLAAVCGAVFLAALTGCDKLPSSVRPLNAPGLTLTAPAPETGVSAQFTLALTFDYRISSGSEAVTGSLTQSQIGGVNGPFSVALPHDGTWLVSGEWLNAGAPFLIGADQAAVQGPTTFTLEMGELATPCYSVTLSQVGGNYGDLFVFDSYTVSFSTIGGPGDIQVVLGTGTFPSMLLQPFTSPSTQFAYLGNGLWADFAAIPSGTVFYSDSLTAKRAVLGPAAIMAVDDVYAVKLSSTNTAFIQVSQADNTGLNPLVFYFRINRHGYPYLKFDVTAYGNTNCNSSGVSLYP
jgi:hypothetical protein